MSRYKFCIVTEGLDWLGERVCHDTRNCIVTSGLLAGRVTIQSGVS